MSKSEPKVGRGNPPKHSQFKKGQSGNPRGRPKNSRNVHSRIVAAAREKVVATNEQGRRTEMTKLDALITQAFNKAAKGDLASIKFALSIVERAQAAIDAQTGSIDTAAQTARDNALIDAFRKKLLGKEEGDGG